MCWEKPKNKTVTITQLSCLIKPPRITLWSRSCIRSIRVIPDNTIKKCDQDKDRSPPHTFHIHSNCFVMPNVALSNSECYYHAMLTTIYNKTDMLCKIIELPLKEDFTQKFKCSHFLLSSMPMNLWSYNSWTALQHSSRKLQLVGLNSKCKKNKIDNKLIKIDKMP